MKLLFDQNISHRIVPLLPERFNESTSVKREGLINLSDFDIWDYAKQHGYTIVTQDSDFNDLNSLLGYPPKIIWIRTGNLKTKEIIDILCNSFAQIEEFCNDENYGCFEILRTNKGKP